MLTYGSNVRIPVENFYGIQSTKPICQCGIEKQLGDVMLNKQEASQAYQGQANKICKINNYSTGERILIKRSFGEYPKLNVNFKDGPPPFLHHTESRSSKLGSKRC